MGFYRYLRKISTFCCLLLASISWTGKKCLIDADGTPDAANLSTGNWYEAIQSCYGRKEAEIYNVNGNIKYYDVHSFMNKAKVSSLWTNLRFLSVGKMTWQGKEAVDRINTNEDPEDGRCGSLLLSSGSTEVNNQSLLCWARGVFPGCVMSGVCPQFFSTSQIKSKSKGKFCILWLEKSVSWFEGDALCKQEKATYANESNVKTLDFVQLNLKAKYVWIGQRSADWFHFENGKTKILKTHLHWSTNEPKKGHHCAVTRVDGDQIFLVSEECYKVHHYGCTATQPATGTASRKPENPPEDKILEHSTLKTSSADKDLSHPSQNGENSNKGIKNLMKIIIFIASCAAVAILFTICAVILYRRNREAITEGDYSSTARYIQKSNKKGYVDMAVRKPNMQRTGASGGPDEYILPDRVDRYYNTSRCKKETGEAVPLCFGREEVKPPSIRTVDILEKEYEEIK